MSGESWGPAYLAVSAALGEPLEGAVASLGDEGAAQAAGLLKAMRSPSRDVRARALAQALEPLAVAVDAMSLS